MFYVGQTWVVELEVMESESVPWIGAQTNVFGTSPPPLSSSFSPPFSVALASAAGTDSSPA